MITSTRQRGPSSGAISGPDEVEPNPRRTIPFLVIGLLLPLVMFEPAPVDLYLVLLIASLAIGGTLRVNRSYVLVALTYMVLGVVGWSLGEAAGAAPTMFAMRSLAIDAYLVAALVSLIGAFKHIPGTTQALIRGYVLGAVIVSVFILAAHHLPTDSVDIYREAGGFRFRGTFKDPNVLGPYLVFPVMMLTFGGLRLRYRPLLALPCLLVMWGAYSRGAYIALAVAAAIYVGARMRYQAERSREWVAGLALVFLAVATVAFLTIRPPANLDDLAYGRLQVQTYDAERFDVLSEALSTIVEQPFGRGPGTFGAEHGTNPHNLVLGKATDAGVLAASLMITVLLASTRKALLTFRTYRERNALIVGASLAGQLAVSVFIYSHHWRHLMILAALAWGTRYECRRRAASTVRHRSAASTGAA